ncbi:MAG: hypothetical protein AB7F41_06755 [Methylocystis sp.]|uniref:hypothetical protein n=1 Tax=Methylocystis sp. TaxID=1911079 RepID=UPI003D13CED9
MSIAESVSNRAERGWCRKRAPKRRAWALHKALADILDDQDDAGLMGTLQLVEDVVMGIERLSEAFDAEHWLAGKQEARSLT